MAGRPKTRARREQTEAQKRASAENLAKGRGRLQQLRDGQAPDPATVPNPLDSHAPARESTRSRIPAQVRKDAKTVLSFGIAGADMAAAFASKASGGGFWTKEDQLSKDETVHLVNAAYAELSDHPKLVQKIAMLAQGQKHAYAGYVATMIALPRLIRHEIVKEDDPIVAALIFAQLALAEQLQEFERDDDDAAPAVPVAPGPTPVDYWRNGNGQIDPRGVPTPVADVGAGAAEQAG